MTTQQEFKQTEIGRIPKEWEIKELKEVVDINKEPRDPTRESPDEKFFYIDIDSIENGRGVIKTAKKIIGKEAPSRARRLIHYNDVIMSTVRPYLKAFAIIPREYDNQICSTGFAVLTCKEKILPLYLLHTLFSKPVIEQCNKTMVGGQYPALNTSQVEKIKLPLPPLHEQKKIAEILSTVDKAIEKVDETIEKTERLKKGLMEKLLTKGIGHKEFKDTEIGRIPKEWEVVDLSKIFEFLDHLRVPVKEQDRTERKGPYPYYGAQGIIDWVNDYIFDGDYILLAEDGENLRSRKLPIAFKVSGKFWVNNHAHVLKIASGVKDEYLIYVLNFINISRYVVGSAQPKLNQSDARKIQLPLPRLPEQKKIAEILSTVDKRLELLREKKEKLDRVKKGLMDDLLSGKRRVTNLISREV